MTRKGKGEMQQITFNFKNVKAREMSEFYKAINGDPSVAMEKIAELLAKTVVEAPVEGDISSPDTWLDLPLWGEEGSDELTWNQAVSALQEAMEQLSKK